MNQLSPYFLVYVRDDGTVRFNYTHAKQILEIFRLLGSGANKPYEELCDIFNNETDNGSQMDRYSELSKTAIAEINSVFKKKVRIGLTRDRGALLIPKTGRQKRSF